MKLKLSYQNSYNMGLFSPFIYTNKQGKKFWLHVKKRGKGYLYFFSKDPTGAINNLPKGFTVTENKTTGMPYIKRKEGGLLGNLLGGLGKKKEETAEEKEETKTDDQNV